MIGDTLLLIAHLAMPTAMVETVVDKQVDHPGVMVMIMVEITAVDGMAGLLANTRIGVTFSLVPGFGMSGDGTRIRTLIIIF